VTYNDKAVETLIILTIITNCPRDCDLKDKEHCPHTIAVADETCFKCWQQALQQEPDVQL